MANNMPPVTPSTQITPVINNHWPRTQTVLTFVALIMIVATLFIPELFINKLYVLCVMILIFLSGMASLAGAITFSTIDPIKAGLSWAATILAVAFGVAIGVYLILI